MYNFNDFKKAIQNIDNWFAKELSVIRTGRATVAILDHVLVESYGAKMPVNQLASISSEDPKTLRITPWDMSQVKNIEKAIGQANLGLSVTSDSSGVRLIFPELTSERRHSLLKIAKDKLEEARVSVRKERTKTLQDFEVKEKAGGVGEDDIKRYKEELQKFVDEANKKLEEMYKRKEQEILG